jgi:hypothetical protein
MRKPYLTEVPILLMFFIRPHTLFKVFEQIKKARPRVLFLVSDAPRNTYPNDFELNQMCKSIVQDIDWDCDVQTYYAYTNQGMYRMGYDSLKWAFEKTDRLIFLEDDVVPNQSFFRFCADTLERYKDDERIHMVCGMNQLGIYNEASSDYFFSKAGSIWGFALWRRTFETFDYEMQYGNDKYILEVLGRNIPRYRKVFIENAYKYINGELNDNERIAFEFQCGVTMYLQNRLILVAKKNMISCIGATEGAAHANSSLRELPKGIQRVFEMVTYEYDFPLKHPNYVMEDKTYEKRIERIFGWGHPLIQINRRIESILRQLIFGDKRTFIKKLHKKILGEKQIER